MSNEKDMERAKEQARSQLDGIVTLMKRFKHIEKCEHGEGREECTLTDKDLVEGLDEYWEEERVLTEKEREDLRDRYHDRDEAEERINEDPLSVEFRGGWHGVGETSEDEEYNILLCTGGPAVRIIGDLGSGGEAHSARLEYQDWGTPWTEYSPMTSEEREFLLAYASHFYYRE